MNVFVLRGLKVKLRFRLVLLMLTLYSYTMYVWPSDKIPNASKK